LLVALLCSLRGSICLYQGEELGLGEADVPYEALQDPYGITFWPNFKGRDGCRTPMPWTDAPLAGFTSGEPWLPIPAEHRAAAVAVQEHDPHSVLGAFRAFLGWRRTMPTLLVGDIVFLDTAEPVLMFERRHAGETLLLAFNLSADVVRVGLPAGTWQALHVPGPDVGTVEADALVLAAQSMYCARRG
jgi:alpha-glucosidase